MGQPSPFAVIPWSRISDIVVNFPFIQNFSVILSLAMKQFITSAVFSMKGEQTHRVGNCTFSDFLFSGPLTSCNFVLEGICLKHKEDYLENLDVDGRMISK
jgi:hypothetical protein